MADERPPEPESPEERPPSPEPPLGPYAPPSQAALDVPSPPPYTGGTRAYEVGRPIPIREMRVGELLDAAIKLYRMNWKIYLGIAAYIIVPLTFIEGFFTREDVGSIANIFRGIEPSEERSTTVIVASLASGLISFFFVLPFLTAAFAKVTSDLYVGGRPDIRETYRFALKKTRSVLWVSLLVGLATFGGFILLIIPAFIFYFRFVFSSAIVVTENLRGTDAMRRSWRLAKGFFWKTFGTLFLAGFLSNIIGTLLSLPLAAVAEVIGPAGWPLAAIGISLGEVVTRPFLTTIVVLMYFDLRIRKEGLDLALMVEDMSTPES